ncbi:MAG: hypothetical protein J6V24_08825 [Clostridia bacterium]|nr:hypothetical protein [Clostridia bacterium]
MNRQFARFTAVLLILCCLTGCGKTLKNSEDFIRKAREVISAEDASRAVMRYAGFVSDPSDHLISLHWVVSGDEHEDHVYLALECERALPDWKYTFSRSYEAEECMEDVAVLAWGGLTVFCINNTDVRGMRWTDADGKDHSVSFEQVPYSAYPFLREFDAGCTSVTLLDAEGNAFPLPDLPD